MINSNRGSNRKRGAQPGNSNALKHGFYSQAFKQSERELLSSVSEASFDNERDLIRVVMHRTMQGISVAENPTVEEYLSALRTFAFAAAVLERLDRSQRLARLLPFSTPEAPDADEKDTEPPRS